MTDREAARADAEEPAPSGDDRAGEDGDGDPVVRTGMDASEAGGEDREFGWRGYVLLAAMVLALVVAPLVVYLRPPALPWRFTLVVFPLVPALLMAVVAVWATARP